MPPLVVARRFLSPSAVCVIAARGGSVKISWELGGKSRKMWSRAAAPSAKRPSIQSAEQPGWGWGGLGGQFDTHSSHLHVILACIPSWFVVVGSGSLDLAHTCSLTRVFLIASAEAVPTRVRLVGRTNMRFRPWRSSRADTAFKTRVIFLHCSLTSILPLPFRRTTTRLPEQRG